MGGDVAAVAGEVERRVGFAVFAVTVRKLADEVGFVTPFGPGLTQVEADRPLGQEGDAISFNCSVPVARFGLRPATHALSEQIAALTAKHLRRSAG